MSGTAGNPFCLYLSKTFIVRMFFADNQSRRYSAARHRASAFASPRSPRDGTAGCTMNGANEVAVAAFLARRCGYLEIVRSIEYALGKSSFAAVPSLGDLGEANAEARCLAAEYLRL